MGEITNFLVWLGREHKAGKIPVQTVQVVGYEIFKFLKNEEMSESVAICDILGFHFLTLRKRPSSPHSTRR